MKSTHLTKPVASFLDFASLAAVDLDLSALRALPVAWQYHDATTAAQTSERLRGVEIVLTNKVVLQEAHFKAHPQIQLVVILATGTNNVDLEAAQRHGVAVCNIVDYSTPSVVQHTIGAMLALRGRLFEYREAVAQGQWCNSPFFGLLDYPVQEVAGSTLGIIGYGQIGRGVARVAEALGMNILVANSLVPGIEHETADSDPPRVPLEQLLAQSDVVSLHCPLSAYSANLLDARKLELMKPSALLINVARGGIVDEAALVNCLQQGKLGGAALDVLAEEPPKSDAIVLQRLPENLLLTPHIAWSSRQSRQRLLAQTHDIIDAYLNARAPLPNLLGR